MTRPACMDADDWAEWDRLNAIQPLANRAASPCEDCTVRFAVEMRLAGRCDGWPTVPREYRPWAKSGQPAGIHEERPRYSELSGQPNSEGAPVTLPVSTRNLVHEDDELGPVRYCRRCDEWWPQDAEFWVIQHRPAGLPNTSRGRTYALRSDVTSYTCRACRREQQARYAMRRRGAA